MTHFRILFGASFVFLFCGWTAAGQSATIRGFVSAERSRPLQGASVVLRQQGAIVTGASTDGDGFFILTRVPPGSYQFEVSHLGYDTHSEAVSLEAMETRLFRIVLVEAAPEALEDVVVEASAETGVTTVRAGLQTITAADVRSVPVPGVSGDLASYLQSVPGVVAQGDRGGQLFVRGGAIDQNLATLDGFPVYYPFHILSFYSAFPEDVIDNAEFYTAGFGASYGTRVSSVVDVSMRNGNKQHLSGSASLSPFLSGVHVEGPLLKDRVSMILAVRESLVKTITPNLLGQKFPYLFGDRFGKLHGTIGNSHSFSLTGLYTYDRGDLAGTRLSFDGEPISAAPVDTNEVAWTNALIGGHYLYRSSRIPLVVDVSSGWSRLTNDVGLKDAPERTSSIESTDAALDATYFLSDGEVRAGARLRRSTFAYDVGGLFSDVTASSTKLAELVAYVEPTVRIAALEVSPGLQLYAPDGGHDPMIDPRIRMGMRFRVLKLPVSVNGAAGVYHQVATGLTDERDIGNVFTAWRAVPEGGTVPRSRHAVLGTRVNIDQHIAVAVESFVKDFSGLSVPVFTASPEFTTVVQDADGRARGVDARASIDSYPLNDHWEADLSVSYSLSEVRYTTATASYNPSHDRRHQATTVARLTSGEVSILIQNQIGSGLPYTASAGFDAWIPLTPDVDVATDPGRPRLAYGSPFGERLPNYVRTDVWIERRVERTRSVLTIRAGALNVFDRDNLFYFDLFNYTRVNQLPLIPSVGLKVEFR